MLVFIIIIILIVSLFGIYSVLNKDEYDSYIEYHYELSLSTNNNNSYVYFPVPIGEDQNITSIFEDKLKIINGNGTFSLIEKKYGICLNVSFTERISLLFNMKIYDDDPNFINHDFFTDLSLNKEKWEYYVFSNNNVTIENFYSYADHFGEIDNYIIVIFQFEDQRLLAGWNSIYFN
jgi:hypothetical protein